MNRRALPLLILAVFAWTFYAMRPADVPLTTSALEQSIHELDALRGALAELKTAVQRRQEPLARAAFHRARRHFKSAEYLLEHFHHQSIKSYINGAPLPQLEANVADIRIYEPQGFQRLEELIYEESLNWSELSRLTSMMEQHLVRVYNYHHHVRVTDRDVLEAMRYELVRVSTMGVTGFDTPASDSALHEARIALNGFKDVLMAYAGQAGHGFDQQAERLFQQADQRLAAASFDDFDRLAFFREDIDPLFRLVRDVHMALHIETLEEVNTGVIATNYRDVQSVFDIRLLNRDFFLKDRTSAIPTARVELGRTLFFDPALSYNNSLSCASCHNPAKAFTDGAAKSISNDQQHTVDRNAPTLVNALFAEAYFHDMRADRLEKQTEHVMVSPKEFNIQTLDLAAKLQESAAYVRMFQEAFPGQREPVQPHNIQNALAAYVATLVSWNSPFDRYVRGESEELDPMVREGFNLFMGKAACGTCHFAPTFAGLVPPFYDDSESEVLGVTVTADSLNPVLDPDLGRLGNGKRAEQAPFFKHSFKTPTVRNVALTAPYFHNGSFATLDDVMWFYRLGGGAGLGLEIENQTLPFDNLDLNAREIDAIIAFMNSLTDVSELQEVPTQLPAFEGITELNSVRTVAY